jgi:formate dehydrogenase subunit beta
MLLNRGDVSGAIGKLLRDVWREARLAGMVVPRHLPGTLLLGPVLIRDWLQIDGVDVLAPVMTANAARLAAEAARLYPHQRLAALLRPCEVLALQQLDYPRKNMLVIGVDCLGTYPAAEYARQVGDLGFDGVTRELVTASRRGTAMLAGSVEHFRRACQLCQASLPDDVDLRLTVVGPATREQLLVEARDAATARRLRLHVITDGPAPAAHFADRVRTAAAQQLLRFPRRDALLRTEAAPISDEAHLAQLAQCAQCQACLDACPLYTGQFVPGDSQASLAALRAWAAGCAKCGMCEAACPQGRPLTVIMAGLRTAARETASLHA